MTKAVIVRSYGAGVFFGRQVERNGTEILLENCRRIWSWKGANTLSEISLRGVGAGSRVAEITRSHLVLDVIEVIECEEAAIASIEAAGWAP